MKIKKYIVIFLVLSIFIYYQSINTFCNIKREISFKRTIPLETAPAELNSKAIMDIKDAFELLIKKSRKYIYISGPYFTSSINQSIIKEIKNAIKRGVKIKFLLSDSPFARQEFSKLNFQKSKNVEVRFLDISKLGSIPYGTFHSKYALFDGKYAFLGSANFSYPAFNSNLEINALIVDKSVIIDLEMVFYLDWRYAGKEIIGFSYIPLPAGQITLIESAPGPMNASFIKDIKETLKTLFKNAKKEINLEVYTISFIKNYFPFYYYLLKHALNRGVDIKIIVRQSMYDKKDKKGDYKNNTMRSTIKDLIKLGIKIKKLNIKKITGKKYSLLHSKLLIVDNKFIMLGSNNWTENAITENREIAIITTYTQMVGPLKKKFDMNWKCRYAKLIH